LGDTTIILTTGPTDNDIVVSLFDKMLNGQPIESSGTLNGILNGTLNDSQQLVYEYIRTHPGCQASEIIDHCGIPRDTLNKILRKLIEEHNLIERRGSKRTGGYYVK
jgi:ATP-dependent DNA helicase RecG